MKKRILLPVILCVILLAGLLVTAAAMEPESGVPEKVTVYIDGQIMDLGISAVLLDSSTYVPVSAFCSALGADSVTWDGETSTVTAPGLTLQATAGESYIAANGRYLYVPATCRVLSGELSVPVRPLAQAFGASVKWDSWTNTVYVNSGTTPITSGSQFYDDDNVYWMSRIIQAEAGGESFLGKIAVGNVVMNRVASPWHPDTVYGVIFDKRSGIQFTPAYSGAIYNKPSEESFIAAKIALEGVSVVGNSLYFSSSHQSCWAARNRQLTATIGNHSFYA